MTRLFRLEDEYDQALETIAMSGPEMAPILKSLAGLRTMRSLDPVQTLFSFLCSSNNHIARISKMVESLASLGPKLPSSEFRAFPSVDRLAAVSEAELRTLGFGYRAASIPRAAEGIAARGGPEWLSELAQGPYEAARAALQELPGVGPKLADCICLFALDFLQAVPFDVHMWEGFHRIYGTGPMPSLTEKTRAAAAAFLHQRFGKWAGIAHQFIFADELRQSQNRAEIIKK